MIYSFEAIEAWDWEQNLARSHYETPMEFAQRLGQARDDLRPDITGPDGYLVTIVYGQRGFRVDVLPALRQFWQVLHG